MMKPIDLFLILVSLGAIVEAEGGDRHYTFENFHKLSYEELHRFAVEQQVANYPEAKPIKSLNTRQGQLLDGTWSFCLDEEGRGFVERWYTGDLERSCDFYRMPVPAAFNEVPSSSEVRDYIGWVWYQRDFYLGPEAYDMLKVVHFDNVNYMAAVWVVGEQENQFLGMHVGGFLPFQFQLNFTDSKEPTHYRLTLAVSNRLTQETIPSGTMVNISEQVGHKYERFEPDFDFFHFAGIMGSVRLVYLPKVHIGSVTLEGTELKSFPRICLTKIIWTLLVCLRNPQLKEMGNMELTIIDLKGLNYNDTRAPDFKRNLPKLKEECIVIKTENFFPDRQRASSGFTSVRSARFKLTVSDEQGNLLWLDTFELKLRRMSENRKKFLASIQDNDISKGRFRLQGFGMHQEQLFAGRFMSGASIFKDIYLLKSMGANVIRTSHYPYSEEFLEACDEADILVVAECQAVGLRTFSKLKLLLHKQLLLEMMERDHGHSSIIAWSVANEPQSQLNESRPYFEELLAYARKELARFTILAHRPLTAALAQSHHQDQVGHTLDLLMINRYYGWYDNSGVLEAIRRPLMESLLGWSRKYPNSRGLIVSEFGADALAGLHRHFSGELYSEEFQLEFLLKYEQVFDEIAANKTAKINFLGSMIWNFADFSTHESLARVAGNRKGLFTREREPKLAVGAIRALYWSRKFGEESACTIGQPEVAPQVRAEQCRLRSESRACASTKVRPNRNEI